ncbi:MAG: hypothetical protein M1G31_05020 [Pseudanabaena sp. Salubria-1]|nr:hypothetical protein [Pseudanabaena sp. Salubria-1]
MILHKYLSPVSPHQTAIAPQHQTPDRLFPKHQTAIAPQHPQTRSPIPQINQRAIAPQHPKPDRLFPHIKQRSPLITHKIRSPKSQRQTAMLSQKTKSSCKI